MEFFEKEISYEQCPSVHRICVFCTCAIRLKKAKNVCAFALFWKRFDHGKIDNFSFHTFYHAIQRRKREKLRRVRRFRRLLRTIRWLIIFKKASFCKQRMNDAQNPHLKSRFLQFGSPTWQCVCGLVSAPFCCVFLRLNVTADGLGPRYSRYLTLDPFSELRRKGST